jgi:hypothetical protein
MDWLPTEAAILVAAGIVLVVLAVIGWDAHKEQNGRDTATVETPEKELDPAQEGQQAEEEPSERSVEEESEQSFPASDPPPY